MKKEHAKQLYSQCKETYKRCVDRYTAVCSTGGIDIKCPSDFDDEFNVPAILLFQELCSGNKKLNGHYDDFRRNLLRAIHDEDGFNTERLAQLPSFIQSRKYKVCFEVFFQKKNDKVSLPFKRQLVVNGIKYRWCSQRTIRSMFDRHQTHQKNSFNIPTLTLDQQRSLYFPTLTSDGRKCIHPMTTTVDAKSAYDALDIALSNFEIVENAVNVAQAIGMRRITFGGRRRPSTTMVTTGIFLASSISDFDDLILCNSGARIHEVPKQKLSFTEDPGRMELFHAIIRASCDNAPVSQRLITVVKELSLAYSTDIPGLRQLSCWRCLELATAKSNDNRKEKDVIHIFQNYYSNQFWKQMGDLVLKSRNVYVHQGKLLNSGGFSSDYYLNWSQQYAEKSLLILLYLYKNRSVWKTEQQIDKFFDYYAESNDSLKVARRLLSARTKR